MAHQRDLLSDELPGLAVVLGLAHFVVDASSGWLVASLTTNLTSGDIALSLLVFNGLGFLAQPLFGIALDRIGHAAAWTGLAVIVQMIALGTAAATWTLLPVALAGLGSAQFHVGAASLMLRTPVRRGLELACFTAPGVLGLVVGAAMAVSGMPATTLLFALGAAAGFFVWLPASPRLPRYPHGSAAHPLETTAIVAAIALRSAAWLVIGQQAVDQAWMILPLATCAAVGKLLGGALSDRFGWISGLGGLLLAGAICSTGESTLLALGASVAALQSATPSMVAATALRLPGRPALAGGLALGFGIALGGMPLAAGVPLRIPSLLIGSAALLLLAQGWRYHSSRTAVIFEGRTP